MTPDERASYVKRQSAALGFDACGVAEADCVDPEDRLGAWLAQGFHAGMAWLARDPETRRDIRRKMPDARSVVVLARDYYAERPLAAPGEGRVSRYAWGRDYHDVLKPSVRTLADRIAALTPDGRCYCSIDTGPVLERAWAARAGIGWLGKHGLLIRPSAGSWCFLAVVATNVAIAPDTPLPDRCGTCARCIEACPTRAIVAPRIVDSARCIAYQTIENRGEIPDEIAERAGDWLFGCDVCQDACPWNREAAISSEQAFHPLSGHAAIAPETIMEMDEAEFSEAFRGTPIVRAKREGLRRNALIVRRNRDGAASS